MEELTPIYLAGAILLFLLGAFCILLAIWREFPRITLMEIVIDQTPIERGRARILGWFGAILILIGFGMAAYSISRETTIHQLKTQLAERDASILALGNQLSDQDDETGEQIIALQNELETRDSGISSLETQLAEREGEIASLETQLGEREAEIAALQAQLNGLQAEIQPAAISSSPLNLPLQEMLSLGEVPFEWQWAGENWYGRLTLQEMNGKNLITLARVGLLEKNLEDRILIEGQVMNLFPGNENVFEITDNGITIHLTVEKKSRRTGIIEVQTISGTLQPVLCYAGLVSYSSSEGNYTGDLVLVQYLSDVGLQVEDWFQNEQAWFENYLIDP